MVIDMKSLRLDPLNPDTLITAKPRRLSQHQEIGNDVKDSDILVPKDNLFKTYRDNSLIEKIYAESGVFRIVAFKDGRHYICRIESTLADMWRLSDQQLETLAKDPKQMIRLPFNNIDQMCINQGQFVFTTKL